MIVRKRVAVLVLLLLLVGVVGATPATAEDPPPPQSPPAELPELDAGELLGDDMLLPPLDREIEPDGFSPQSTHDPLGLVVGASTIRSYSLGHSNIAVYVCQVPSNTTNVSYAGAVTNLPWTPEAIADWANDTVPGWFATASGGAYTVSFTAATTISLTPTDGPLQCADKAVQANNYGQYSNVMAIDTSDLGGGLGGYIPPTGRRGFWVGGSTASYFGDEIGTLDSRGVVIHEIGHTLDWPHSHWSQTNEYDNPVDVMSDLWGPNNIHCQQGPWIWPCYTMNTLAFNRYAAGWIDPSDVQILTPGTHNLTLRGPERSGTQMAVVDLGGRYLTLEARPNEGLDQAIDVHGVAVHTIDQSNGWGLWRRQRQAVGSSHTYNHVARVGHPVNAHGANVQVTGQVTGGYNVSVTVGNPGPSVPGAPRSVSAAAGDRRATVSWQAPSSNGGSSISGYTATASPGSRSCSTNGSGRSCTITGLSNGTNYQVRVRATNAAGSGAQSSAVSVRPFGVGYWMAAADGAVYGFGESTSNSSRPGPTVAVAAAPNGGYWLLHADGRVTARGATNWGDARFDLLAFAPGERVTTMSGMPDGSGYWIFTNRGRVLSKGFAPHRGDLIGIPLNGPIVDSIATPDGQGYYMVGSDGGVFSFGSARFHGSTGSMRLNQPVVALIPTPGNDGYWLVAADGGIFAFNAPFRGSVPGALPAGSSLNRPVIGGVPYGNGYVLIASDGGAFSFSNQPFLGSLGGNPPASPIIGLAVRRG